MRIFLAGATGALGRRLVPHLVARGHQVTGMTRSHDRAAGLSAAGAEAVVADALDRQAVLAAVAGARPEVVVHQLTALARLRSMRRFDDEFAMTNRLRTQGTHHLIEAAQAAGAHRLVAQSYAGWPYQRAGGPAKSEADPLDPDPPRRMWRSLAAIRALEAAVLGARDLEGLVLRYGAFYGPGLDRGRQRHRRVGAAAQVPHRRWRRRRVVLRPHRRRRQRDRGRHRRRPAWHL